MNNRSALSYSSELTMPVSRRDHIIGPPDAMVTLVEYANFQCQPCAEVTETIVQLLDFYGDNIRYVYRHFPLTEIHPQAEQAAEASEAAAAEGKFWVMHRLLFEYQEKLDEFSLIGYAEMIGLEPKRFTLALRTERHRPRVEQDFVTGIRSGVNSTPTFFLNSVLYAGSHDIGGFSEAINRILKGKA